MRLMRAQGATEYLVLLAVVLIVALVSVALLGFFPGMASDAQITQSQIYWQSASPIAIMESAARVYSADGSTRPYIRIKNTGMYPIRLTAIIGGDGGKAITFYGNGCGITSAGYYNISDYYYLAPGEEKYFNWAGGYGLACERVILSYVGDTSSGYFVYGASSVCQNSTTSPGVLDYKSLGFEYIQYMDSNQQITKRQIGKDFIVKCMQPV
ncbi:MAG: hypothetical protein WCY41_01260 [Candidatus Micrarchaeia archaeon]